MSWKWPPIAMFLVLCGLAWLDKQVLHRGPLEEGIPVFELRYLVRSGIIAAASWWFVARWERWSALKSLRNDHAEVRPPGQRMVLLLWSALAGCTVLFLASPYWFSTLAREDRPVEVLSAALLFGNSVLFGSLFGAMRRWTDRRRGLILTVLLGLTAGFFLIGMEEVSWFQRVLSVQTPGAFENNLQREMNLHNFATDTVENAYYFASFAVLVLLPFLYTGVNGGWPAIAFFVPGRASLLAAASFVPLNYDMWNGIPTQTAFFLTAAILLFCARTWSAAERSMAWIGLALVIAVQALFLALGHRSGRLWDVTEYKELFIPAAFAVYGLELAAMSRRLRSRPENPAPQRSR